MQTMRWGLVPHWTRFDAPTSEVKTINARGENLLEPASGMWTTHKKWKRCVVPAEERCRHEEATRRGSHGRDD